MCFVNKNNFIKKMAQSKNSTEVTQHDTIAQTSKSNNDIKHLDCAEYFMAVAFLAAKRSKDPRTKVGACIINRANRILGIGYNEMPTGCTGDDFPWEKNENDILQDKSFYVCHAEVNAILNKNCCDVSDCIMYVTLFPCNECAKVIIQSGIKEVIYMSNKKAHKKSTQAAKRMFEAAGVACKPYGASTDRIIIDFDDIEKYN